MQLCDQCETFIRSYFLSDKAACKRLISWVNTNKELQRPGVFLKSEGNVEDKNVKESLDIPCNIDSLIANKDLFIIVNEVWQCVELYIKEFSALENLNIGLDPFFIIQEYKPPTGGFKKWHHERGSINVSRRMLTWMVYLNTIHNEGGTEFKYQKIKVNAEEGKILIWPSDFTHTHRGIVAPNETKYIITGWCCFGDESSF